QSAFDVAEPLVARHVVVVAVEAPAAVVRRVEVHQLSRAERVQPRRGEIVTALDHPGTVTHEHGAAVEVLHDDRLRAVGPRGLGFSAPRPGDGEAVPRTHTGSSVRESTWRNAVP